MFSNQSLPMAAWSHGRPTALFDPSSFDDKFRRITIFGVVADVALVTATRIVSPARRAYPFGTRPSRSRLTRRILAVRVYHRAVTLSASCFAIRTAESAGA